MKATGTRPADRETTSVETRFFIVDVKGHDHLLFAKYHGAANYCYTNGYYSNDDHMLFVDLHTANIKQVWIPQTVLVEN